MVCYLAKNISQTFAGAILMELINQLYSYKNGLESTLTILSLCQALYLGSIMNARNVGRPLAIMFLLLAFHFLLLTLSNTFSIFISDFLYSILLAIYGPLSFFITRMMFTSLHRDNLRNLLLIVLFGIFVFQTCSFIFLSPIGIEYAWNIVWLLLSFQWAYRQRHALSRDQRRWLFQFLIGFLIIFCSYLPVFLAANFYTDLFIPVKIPFTILFLIFGLNNFRHIILKPTALSASTFASEVFDQRELAQIDFAITQCMREQKPFLEPNFDLKKLSNLIGFSERKVSETINRTYRQNFNQFTNEYRIEVAIQLMKEDVNNSLLIKEIMYAAGFNHKVSFTNAFKLKCGTTPSDFRKQNQLSSI